MNAPANTIVVHMTAANIYAGFAGENLPKCVIPNVMAVAQSGSRFFLGEEAIANRESCTLSYPMAGDKVDWIASLQVIKYALLDQLQIDPSRCVLVMVEPSFVAGSNDLVNRRTDRERLARIAFDALKVAGLYLTDAALCLNASGWSDSQDAQLSIWRGASAMAGQENFHNLAIPVDEYRQFGPAVVHQHFGGQLS
ncbi:MAG TPA: hypothetical protein VKZ53_13275 [Candidatus Angelobacter sp.]|nr:hypothetical protein [Candidatus Angelobacter sp.]